MQDEQIKIDDYDWFKAQNWAETSYLVGKVGLFSPRQTAADSNQTINPNGDRR